MRFTDPEGICCACGKEGVDLNHVKSRGAGGTNDQFNLMPLCRLHHSQFHTIGNNRMAEVYTGVGLWLKFNEWEYDAYIGKWIHEKKEN